MVRVHIRYVTEAGAQLWRSAWIAGIPVPGLGDDVLLNGVRYEVLFRTFDILTTEAAITIKVQPSSRVG